MTDEGWRLPGAQKDQQSITADWQPAREDAIAGVIVYEIRNVLKDTGVLTEMYRRDWNLDSGTVAQVFQVVLDPGSVSAWHAHGETQDRLFASQGRVKIVLFDAREGSPSRGVLSELRLGRERPALVTIPPGVWHGVQNVGAGPAVIVNLVDREYQYEDPDHWRLPPDSPEIPYRFRGSGQGPSGQG